MARKTQQNGAVVLEATLVHAGADTQTVRKPLTRPFILQDIVVQGSAAITENLILKRIPLAGGAAATILDVPVSATLKADFRPFMVALTDATNNPSGAPFRIAPVRAADVGSVQSPEDDAYTLVIEGAGSGAGTVIVSLVGNFV